MWHLCTTDLPIHYLSKFSQSQFVNISLIKNLHNIVFPYSAIFCTVTMQCMHTTTTMYYKPNTTLWLFHFAEKCCIFTKYSALDSSMLSRETHNGVKVVQW